MNLPENVIKVLKKIEDGGFMAFVAGGAIRDMLMNKTPNDYDIATNALPSDVKRIFSKTIDTGIQHGTVTVIESGAIFEITTFRCDGEYLDGRHPSQVEFVEAPYEDCKRRDFTINALMYNPSTGIIDFFDGKKDIKNKIIKCVGDPTERFHEDALRMLRAIRFSAVLSFEIDVETEKAIKKCAVLIKKVSAERIRNELNKILLSENPDCFKKLERLGLLKHIIPELSRCFGEPQKNKYHIYDVGDHIMATVKNTPPELVLRWAALMHDIGKPCCSSTDQNGIIHFYGHHRESRTIAIDVLHRLRLDKDTIHDVSILVENHDVRVEPTPCAVKRMLNRVGEELFEKLLILQTADNMAKNPIHFPEKYKKINAALNIYKQVVAEQQPYLISHLAVNGKDLIKIGFKPGRDMGDVFKILLDDVIKNQNMNNRTYLIERAKALKKSKKI